MSFNGRTLDSNSKNVSSILTAPAKNIQSGTLYRIFLVKRRWKGETRWFLNGIVRMRIIRTKLRRKSLKESQETPGKNAANLQRDARGVVLRKIQIVFLWSQIIHSVLPIRREDRGQCFVGLAYKMY